MTRYHTVSGGAGSWLAAKVDIDAHPRDEHRFVFADTLYEDADCYRFLIEGCAYLLGRDVRNVLPQAGDFPDYRVLGDFDIETYDGNPEWRAFLARLRVDVAEVMPELIWLVEGRDPWEVFRDEKMLGNSRFDPCSKILKRKQLDAWRSSNCNKSTDAFTVGIGEHEAHRFINGNGGGLGPRMAAMGWTYEAPLVHPGPWQFGAFGYLVKAGIAKPRMYLLGYLHANCGGFCIKAGHAHYQNRFRKQPERFAYDEMMEGKIIVFLGRPVAMMTDRSGDNVKKPMPLSAFRAGLESKPELDFEYTEGSSGCGCAIDYEEAA